MEKINNHSRKKVQCQTCRDTGNILIPCPLCEGERTIEETIKKECPTCKGEVFKKCIICEGTGVSITGNPCHACGGDKFPTFCPTCANEKTIDEKIKKDCPKCYSQGVIAVDCPDCKGLRKIEVER